MRTRFRAVQFLLCILLLLLVSSVFASCKKADPRFTYDINDILSLIHI